VADKSDVGFNGESVSMPLSQAKAGLPGLCPRHGLRATGWRDRTFHMAAPLWLGPLVLVAGPLAAAFVDEKTRVSVRVPECARCAQDRLQMRIVVLFIWLMFFVGLGAAFTGDTASATGWLFLVTLFAAPIASFTLPRRAVIQGCITRDHGSLMLRPVAPAFRSAVAANEVGSSPID
jgi:hypothetical protein